MIAFQHNSKCVKAKRPNRRGLSLIEVLLAIALLGSSMAIIYQLIGIGYRSAMETQLYTDAAVLVDSKMAEVAAGVLPLENSSQMQIEEAPDWLYTVDVGESEQAGLLVVTVTVERADGANPVQVSVVRFMPDPDYDPFALED